MAELPTHAKRDDRPAWMKRADWSVTGLLFTFVFAMIFMLIWVKFMTNGTRTEQGTVALIGAVLSTGFSQLFSFLMRCRKSYRRRQPEQSE